MRFTELFSEWTYLAVAQSVTTFGRLAMIAAPIFNLIVGLYLLWRYRLSPHE